MDSPLKKQIDEDVKSAMREKDVPRRDTLRMLLAAIKQKEVDERVQLKDQDISQIIEKMIKQRRESIAMFQQGNRQDLVDKEQKEVDILLGYLPKQLSPEEIKTAINQAIADTQATSVKDIGKVMPLLKERLAGKADMSEVSKLVKDCLSS